MRFSALFLHFDIFERYATLGAPKDKKRSSEYSQFDFLKSGAFEFTIDGVKKVVRAGDVLYKLPHIPHGCVCLEEGVLPDTFTPHRADFLK